jgi:hypothetical protein
MRNGYWKCTFEGKNGETIEKTIYAKTSQGAFKHTYEMGVRLGMTPKYETLREATNKEVKEFKKIIKERAKKNERTN